MHEIAPTALHESGTLALIVPSHLFWYVDSYIQRSDSLLHRCWTRRRHDPDQSNPNPSLARTSSDFFGQTYEANDVALDGTRHGTTTGPSTMSPYSESSQRRALGLIERGRRHRSSERGVNSTACLQL